MGCGGAHGYFARFGLRARSRFDRRKTVQRGSAKTNDLCAARAIPILFGSAGIVAESFISIQLDAQNEGIHERVHLSYVIVHGHIEFEGNSTDDLNNNELIRQLYLGV